jgi:Aspartyl protease/PDZ domain
MPGKLLQLTSGGWVAGPRKLITAAALVLSLGTTATAASPPIQNSGDAKMAAAASRPLHVVPFELYGNLAYIQVRVNGSEPCVFILDTGAGVSVMNRSVVSEMRITPVELGERGSFGFGEGKTKVAVGKNVTFGLGDLNFQVANVLVLQLDDLESAVGRRVFGILGYELFNRYVVELDHAARTIKLYDPKDYTYAGPGETVALTIRDNSLRVQAHLAIGRREAITGDFALDTGMSGPLSLNSPVVKKYGVIEPGQPVFSMYGGIGGQLRFAPGRVTMLQLGSLSLHDVPVLFSQATTGASSSGDYLGTIGAAVLSRYKMIFDCPHHRLTLESLPSLADPFREDASGMVLSATSPDFKTIRVRTVFENTAAWNAGLREGDGIASVNGQPASELDLEKIRQMLAQPEQKFDLEVRRGDQTLQVKLTTKKWF